MKRRRAVEVGFFGKLRSAGDFVQRRLPAPFVQAWDRQLGQALARAQAQLGETWDARYGAGPVWRFMLPRGVCGEQAWVGVVGPSQDRVGRTFPMTLAAPFDGDTAAARQILACRTWFEALEQIQREACAETVSVEVFDRLVMALPDPAATMEPDTGWILSQVQQSASCCRLPLPIDDRFLGACWVELAARRDRWCLWWSGGDGRQAPTVLATCGMVSNYAALLNGAAPSACGAGPVAPSRAGPMARHPLPAPATPPALAADTAMTELGGGRLWLLLADETAAAPGLAGQILRSVDPRLCQIAQVREALLAWQRPGHGSRHTGAANAPQASALAIRFDALHAQVLGLGNADAWHWRQGRLRPLFASRGAAVDGIDALLFGDSRLPRAGLGSEQPAHIEHGACEWQAGDRLLLLATHGLTRLHPELLAEAMALDNCESAKAQIARLGGMTGTARSWPLMVTECQA